MAHLNIGILRRILVLTGISLIIPSAIYLLLGMLGIASTEFLAIGESSGLRTIASVAVLGCLITAIGFWDD